jgi:hypothetical protein
VSQHRAGENVKKPVPQDTQTRSRLIIGEFGPSDSALAAARGGRLRRTAADRHAARYASRDLCSGGAPRRYTPSLGPFHVVVAALAHVHPARWHSGGSPRSHHIRHALRQAGQRRRAECAVRSAPAPQEAFLCTQRQTKAIISQYPLYVIVRSSRRTRSPPFNSGRDLQARTALGCGTASFRSGQDCASLQYALASLRPGQPQRSDLAPARSERSPPSLGQAAGGRASPAPHHPVASQHPLRSPGTGLHGLGLRPHGRGGFASHLSFRPSQTGVKRDSKKKRFFSSRVSHRAHHPCHTAAHLLSQLHRSLV